MMMSQSQPNLLCDASSSTFLSPVLFLKKGGKLAEILQCQYGREKKSTSVFKTPQSCTQFMIRMQQHLPKIIL